MKRILIIEDDPVLRELYGEWLLSEQYQVICTDNGQDGLDKILKYRPDLLILDLAIPCINGRSLLSKIKKVARRLPIFIISAKVGMQDDPEIALSSQIHRFFVKPCQQVELLHAMDTVLSQRQFPEPANDSPLGQHIGGCTLEEYIGGKTGGVVCKAQYRGSTVAIKILPRDFSSDPERVARFHREARSMVEAQHPNIIPLLDMGITDNEMYFIIMEYFDGESLDKILEQIYRFSPQKAVEIICQIAQGMQSAHAHGIIHRDLKPSNVLYNQKSNVVKIIDFGMARRIPVDQKVTQQGCVVGTPYYMSPEQCRGLSLDHRTDIYSLGIVFYQLVTGRIAFNKPSIMQIMEAHVCEALPWEPRDAQLPQPLRDIIEKMTCKKREKRYSSMQQLICTLVEWLDDFQDIDDVQ